MSCAFGPRVGEPGPRCARRWPIAPIRCASEQHTGVRYRRTGEDRRSEGFSTAVSRVRCSRTRAPRRQIFVSGPRIVVVVERAFARTQMTSAEGPASPSL